MSDEGGGDGGKSKETQEVDGFRAGNQYNCLLNSTQTILGIFYSPITNSVEIINYRNNNYRNPSLKSADGDT